MNMNINKGVASGICILLLIMLNTGSIVGQSNSLIEDDAGLNLDPSINEKISGLLEDEEHSIGIIITGSEHSDERIMEKTEDMMAAIPSDKCAATISYVKKSTLRMAVSANCVDKLDIDGMELVARLRLARDNEDYDGLFDFIVDSLIESFEGRLGDAKSRMEMKSYSGNPAFIVSDENWEEVLMTVPAAIWSKGSEECNDLYDPSQKINRHICGYPLLIYHKESSDFDADSVLWFIKQNKPDKVYMIGDTPEDLRLSLLKDGIDVVMKGNDDILDFWDSYDTAVVSEGDYKTAMIAASYASFIRSPLFVQSDSDLAGTKGKEVICIGNVREAKCDQVFSTADIQKELARKTGSNKMILVNPNDIKKEFCESGQYSTDMTSGQLSEIYCKASLAAPFLAAAKDESIIFTSISAAQGMTKNRKQSDVYGTLSVALELTPAEEENIEFLGDSADMDVKRAYNQLFVPKYLTVIAGPKAVPLSYAEERSFTPPGESSEANVKARRSFDRRFADLNNDGAEDIAVGRIMGRSVSSVSAYIARAVFGLSVDPDSSLFVLNSIAKEDNAQTYIESIKINSEKAGYDAKCIIDSNLASNFGLRECSVGLAGTEEFSGKKMILLDGNGLADGIENVLTSSDFPFIDPSLILTSACHVNNYYISESDNLFGSTALDRGAIGEIGFLGSGSYYNLYKDKLSVRNPLLLLFFVAHENDYDLGNIMKEFSGKVDYSLSEYALFGDPTVRVDLPKLELPAILYSTRKDISGAEFDAVGMESWVGYYVTDLGGNLDNLGDQTTLMNGVERIEPDCKRAGYSLACSAGYTPDRAGRYIFEMRSYDKSNEYYMSDFLRFDVSEELSIVSYSYFTKIDQRFHWGKAYPGMAVNIKLDFYNPEGADKIKDMSVTIDGEGLASTECDDDGVIRSCLYEWVPPAEIGEITFKAGFSDSTGQRIEDTGTLHVIDLFSLRMSYFSDLPTGRADYAVADYPVTVVVNAKHALGTDHIADMDLDFASKGTAISAEGCNDDLHGRTCEYTFTQPKSGYYTIRSTATDKDGKEVTKDLLLEIR